jgi:hypothetical protein
MVWYNPTEFWRRAKIEARRPTMYLPFDEASFGSRGDHVEPMPTIATFDLDHPEIWIIPQFAAEARLGD